MTRFSREDPIFRTERPFREDYEPTTLHEREDELDEYADALNPIIKGDPPKNIFIYGKAGVGKTVATKHLLSDLKEQADKYNDVSLSAFHLSCRHLTSSYQVAAHLINKIRDQLGKDSIPITGYPTQKLYDMLFDSMDEIGGTILIVLDEIDHITKDDDILYSIPRATANGDVSNCEPGIIGISNDFKFQESLSPEVQDTLCDEQLNFAPYIPSQLRSILKRRSEKAFFDDVMDEAVIPQCAAIAAKDTGSARQALRLLYKAGELARDDNSLGDTISNEHVTAAQTKLEQNKLLDGMRTLTTYGHIVLCSLVQLTLESKTPAKTKDIYETYLSISETLDVKTLTKRRMTDHLQELARHGFLDREIKNSGSVEGRYALYKLNVDLELALDALEQADKVSNLIAGYRATAEDRGILDTTRR